MAMRMISRRLGTVALLLASLPLAAATTVDRIAAVVDRQVITVSEVTQMVELHFFPRTASQSDDDYRHDVLEALIAQALRFRDVERFGAEDVPKDSIESRVQEIAKRFASPAAFDAALQKVELSSDELRALVKRQLQVEQYIQERFAPLIFVSNDEIDTYYRGTWSQQRRADWRFRRSMMCGKRFARCFARRACRKRSISGPSSCARGRMWTFTRTGDE